MNYAVLFVNGETKEFATREEMIDFVKETKGKGIVVYGETQYINILTTKNIKK